VFLPEAPFCVGIDWAAESHAVCVLDAYGKITSEFTIVHTADGFADLLRRLGRLGEDRTDVPVGIERPDGRLVDALLEAGHPVVPANPNAIRTWRDGEVLSGAKSDAGDAAVIAGYLRLRAHRVRPATPYTAETKGAAHRGPHPRRHCADARRGDQPARRVARREPRRRPRPRRRPQNPRRRPQGSRPVRRRPSTRTPRSSRRCQGRVGSTPPRCSPSGATPAQPTTGPTPSPPSPG